MKRIGIAVTTTLLFASVMADNPAIKPPQTPFKAFINIEAPSMELNMNGPFWYDEGLERREISMQGVQMIMLTRPDQNAVFTVMPQQKMAMKTELQPDMQYYNTEWLDDTSVEEVGSESVNGEATTRYTIDGDDARGSLWMTTDGIMLQMHGEVQVEGVWHDFRMTVTDIERGPIEPSVFDVPAGIQVVEMPPPEEMQ